MPRLRCDWQDTGEWRAEPLHIRVGLRRSAPPTPVPAAQAGKRYTCVTILVVSFVADSYLSLPAFAASIDSYPYQLPNADVVRFGICS